MLVHRKSELCHQCGGVDKQKKIIHRIVSSHVDKEIRSALDYGGNRGASFYDELGTASKYVYDISGVKTLPGIIGITDFAELKRNHYDFIMCNMVFEHLVDPYDVMDKLYSIGDDDTVYYLEVPSENPFTNGNKFSAVKNLSLLFNRNYSWIRLAKYYFYQRKLPFMPMKEHINFFTINSLKTMAETSGFSIMDIQKNSMDNSTVLSMLFKKRSKNTHGEVNSHRFSKAGR